MSLKLVESYRGISAEYWRIGRIFINLRDNTAHVDVDMYFNETVRRANVNDVIRTESFKFNLLQEPTHTNLYEMVKALDFFKGAEDC